MAEDVSFIETMGTEFVILYANGKLSGHGKYSAHKNLVCRASPVLRDRLQFQATLQAEEIRNELYFDELEYQNGKWTDNVQDFMHLLYRDRKAIIDRPRDLDGCLRLYLFADAFEVDDLRDIAIDGIQDRLKTSGRFLSEMMDAKKVYGYTRESPKNKLRLFYIALRVFEHTALKALIPGDIMDHMGLYPSLLEDWLAFQRDEHLRRVGIDPRNRVRHDEDMTGFPVCYFHVHPPDQECTTMPNKI